MPGARAGGAHHLAALAPGGIRVCVSVLSIDHEFGPAGDFCEGEQPILLRLIDPNFLCGNSRINTGTDEIHPNFR